MQPRQGALHLGIRALGAHLALHLLGGKDFGKTVAGGILLVVLDEQGDEVRLAGLFFLLGFLHRLHEGGILLVVGQYGYHIGYRHLEDDVHTTLQVQTETDFHLAALLEGIHSKINFLVHDGIKILLSGLLAHGSRLVGVVAGDKREGQIEYADKHERYCDKLYNSFVLHFVFIIVF